MRLRALFIGFHRQLWLISWKSFSMIIWTIASMKYRRYFRPEFEGNTDSGPRINCKRALQILIFVC